MISKILIPFNVKLTQNVIFIFIARNKSILKINDIHENYEIEMRLFLTHSWFH